MYGPTEASIDVSYYKCKRDNSDLSSVPIGRPIWNTQLYILDNHLNPVPLGVEGELYIGGIGLAVAPGFTFIKNPSADKVRIAFIGVGGRGRNHLQNILNRDDVIVPAICDIDPKAIVKSKSMIENKQKQKFEI